MGKFYELFAMDAVIGVQELGLMMMKVCDVIALFYFQSYDIVHLYACFYKSCALCCKHSKDLNFLVYVFNN